MVRADVKEVMGAVSEGRVHGPLSACAHALSPFPPPHSISCRRELYNTHI